MRSTVTRRSYSEVVRRAGPARSPIVKRAYYCNPYRHRLRSNAMSFTGKHHRSARAGAVLIAFLVSAACSGGTNTPTTNHVLVVDKSFDMKTADPQREFEVSG